MPYVLPGHNSPAAFVNEDSGGQEIWVTATVVSEAECLQETWMRSSPYDHPWSTCGLGESAYDRPGTAQNHDDCVWFRVPFGAIPLISTLILQG